MPKPAKPLPPIEDLQKAFTYNLETGELRWSPDHRQRGGMPAGSSKNGYIQIRFGSKQRIYAHRVIWALAYGTIEPIDIDHIDGNPSNNAISNLRNVPHADNTRNARLAKTNKTGVSGVRRDGTKWSASIGYGKNPGSYLGRFSNFDDAVAARKAAEAARGYHPNHGRVQ